MEFSEFLARTQSWIRENNSSFSVFDSVETEKKITLSITSKDVNFYVILPENGAHNFLVWSENDDVLRHLGAVVDRLNSCKTHTLEETLKMVNEALAPIQGAINMETNNEDEGISDDSDCDEEDDDYDVDMYYQEDDDDALAEDVAPSSAAASASVEEDIPAKSHFAGQGNTVAAQRLMKDMMCLSKVQDKIGIQGAPEGDDLFQWEVKLTDIPKDSKLGQDVENYAQKYKRERCILMEMRFPKDYPYKPPFVRIKRPRFKFLTGHVTIGGSICMQLLTNSGWSPTNDIESVLVQIRAEILSDPDARLDSTPDRQYDLAEAESAFKRMVVRYGWE